MPRARLPPRPRLVLPLLSRDRPLRQGSLGPADILRLSPARAHRLAGVIDDFATHVCHASEQQPLISPLVRFNSANHAIVGYRICCISQFKNSLAHSNEAMCRKWAGSDLRYQTVMVFWLMTDRLNIKNTVLEICGICPTVIPLRCRPIRWHSLSQQSAAVSR